MEQVAILARVSTQRQDYERQVMELTDYCQRMHWAVVKVFANKVSGATKNADREEISGLVEYVKKDMRKARKEDTMPHIGMYVMRQGFPMRQTV